MNNIDKELENRKKELENIEVPDELEGLLREGLKDSPVRKRHFNIRSQVAALLIVALLIGFNVDTLAYYGKKLMGYDDIMDGTLKELNNLEKGQIVDKSYKFNDGSKVTLDGVMLDDNNLVVFYSMYDPNGNVGELFDVIPSLEISGSSSGQGETSKDGKTMNWVMRYETPSFFKKNISLEFINLKTSQKGKIDFKLDKNKAMGKKIKIDIDEKIKVGDKTIKLESLLASPMSTVVKGHFQNIVELGLDKLKGERVFFELIEFDLLADGKLIRTIGSSNSSSLKGARFNLTFERIPDNTKEIVLKLRSFGASEPVDQKFTLDKGEIDKTISVLDNDINIIINRVYEKEGNTYIDLTTEENIYLNSFHLNIDGKEVNQEQTIEEDEGFLEKEEGESLKFYRSRTIEFIGTGEKLELHIERIRYTKDYDKVIYTHTIE